MEGPAVLVPIFFFAMITAIAVGVPYVRGMVKRWEREDAAPKIPSDVSGRLEHMERAIDAIAVEVERISEGQRFTTRLLSESKNPNALPSSSRSTD